MSHHVVGGWPGRGGAPESAGGSGGVPGPVPRHPAPAAALPARPGRAGRRGRRGRDLAADHPRPARLRRRLRPLPRLDRHHRQAPRPGPPAPRRPPPPASRRPRRRPGQLARRRRHRPARHRRRRHRRRPGPDRHLAPRPSRSRPAPRRPRPGRPHRRAGPGQTPRSRPHRRPPRPAHPRPAAGNRASGSDTCEGLGAEGYEMNTRHSRRISRKAAEQLLDGAAGRGQGTEAGPDQLVSVLAAAAAPGPDNELAGEQMAVAAFEANHLASVANFRREQMIKSPLAKILTVKVLASVLVVGASGGVALAASTGTFSSSGSGSGPAYGGSSVAAPVTPPAGGFIPSPSDSGSASASASPSGDTQQPAASSSGAASSSPASIPQTAAGLCNALAGDVAGAGGSLTKAAQQQALASGGVSKALQSPEFSSLVSTAQSAANVPDYCGLLLDLPQLPQPAQLTQLPVSLLSQLLTQVPAATLAQPLTSLPSSTLSALLAELPVSTVSQIL